MTAGRLSPLLRILKRDRHMQVHGLTTRAIGRIRLGDSSAANEFWKELAPQVVRIIRRVIRTGVATSALARRIATEVRRLVSGVPASIAACLEKMTEEITRRICRATIDGLQSRTENGCDVLETVLQNWGAKLTLR